MQRKMQETLPQKAYSPVKICRPTRLKASYTAALNRAMSGARTRKAAKTSDSGLQAPRPNERASALRQLKSAFFPQIHAILGPHC